MSKNIYSRNATVSNIMLILLPCVNFVYLLLKKPYFSLLITFCFRKGSRKVNYSQPAKGYVQGLGISIPRLRRLFIIDSAFTATVMIARLRHYVEAKKTPVKSQSLGAHAV